MDQIDTINKIAKFLNVQIEKSRIESDEVTLKSFIKGREYAGLATTVLKLIEISKQQHWINKEQECSVYQWLEFASTNSSQINMNTPPGKAILKDLNNYLENCSYFVGYSRTIADIVIYHVVYNAVASMSPSDKETYIHLCRWFDHLQFDETVRQNNEVVNFSSNYISTRISIQN